ncbi:MAG: rhodanese-like domain-containing protein [Gemmatimonadaceae bacterium]|nr:rhodanese-like domain-containing protein [Gemmatimonadaceae bacterium]
MPDFLKNLSLNGKLAVVALVLGFLALFGGTPYQGAAAVVNTKEAALQMAAGSDQVGVTTLADWIIQGRADFRVVDLRDDKAYAEYHIPPAENIPVAGLLQAGLQHNEKLVLYAEDGARTAQAWMLLKARGYKGVYILRGGLAAWKDSVLFPRVADNATPAQMVEFAKMKEVSKFFGGTPQTAAGDSSAARQMVVMPKLAMPATKAGPAGAPKKKKKEGC